MTSIRRNHSQIAIAAYAALEAIHDVLEAAQAAVRWADRERRRTQSIAWLEALDARTLSDIGLDRTDIQRFAHCARPRRSRLWSDAAQVRRL